MQSAERFDLPETFRVEGGVIMKKDLSDCRFGQWTVIKDSGERLKSSCNSRVRWLCQCSCGNTALITNAWVNEWALKEMQSLRKPR